MMRPEERELARSQRGFMPDSEGEALYEAGVLAARSGLGPMLEIGTYCAKSALYLGFAARSYSTVLYSVDHHRGSEENQFGWEHHDPDLVDPATGRMDTLPEARRAVERAGLEATVVLVVGDSACVASAWSTPLSLLFIDGGHGEAVAWADYLGWAPHVAGGAIMAIHDVFPDPADGGRPPYEIFCHAMQSGLWSSRHDLSEGSLKVLERKSGCDHA
jgi:predicted O-methyltransferase YrrM